MIKQLLAALALFALALRGAADAKPRAIVPGAGANPFVAAASAATTWNPSDLLDITLSNGSLTALSTLGSGNGGEVRATAGKSSGKWFFTANIDNGIGSTGCGSWVIGLASASYPFSDYLGQTTTSIGYFPLCGSLTTNNATLATIETCPQGTTVWVAADLTNLLEWVRCGSGGNWNNSGTANPSTGAGGASLSGLTGAPFFPAFEGALTTSQATANFAPTADGTLTGFSQWQ